MKKVYTTQEGVKMNSQLDFGSTHEIRDQFRPLMVLLETMYGVEFGYYYRLTDDGYLQLASSHNGETLDIKAQYKLICPTLKENALFVVRNYIEANVPYNGFPHFFSSNVFTEEEFETMIDALKKEREERIKKAGKRVTPLITFLKDQNLNPNPSGDASELWNAICPSGRNHFLLVNTEYDEWLCGYCRKKGKQEDLQKWLLEIKKNDASRNE